MSDAAENDEATNDAAANAAVHAFDCPLCDGAFEVLAKWLGQSVACPHCGEEVQLPSEAPAVAHADTPSAAPPPSPSPLPSSPRPERSEPRVQTPSGPAESASVGEPRKPTPAERQALRRRVNLVLAIGGTLLLIGLFLLLAQLG